MNDIEEFERMEKEMEGNPLVLFGITLLGAIGVLYGMGAILALL